MSKITTGTKEWAFKNMNIYTGCYNDCRYCYARIFNVGRFKRKSVDTWSQMDLHEKNFLQNHRKRQAKEGEDKAMYDYMFPTAHDIFEFNLDCCITKLWKLLSPGNTVLITSKPRLPCISEIMRQLLVYKKQIGFMFTITSTSTKKLRFWEPNAPLFEDRLNALQLAYHQKYITNVSIEPSLDKNPINIILKVAPFVSGKIWLGCMNWFGWIRKLGPQGEEAEKFYNFAENISKLPHIHKILTDISKLPKVVKDKIMLKDSIVNLYKRNNHRRVPQL